VLNDYRVWAKIPYIDEDGVSYKDEIDWSDETIDIPPVANAGPGVFATIDSGTSKITVDFDSANSFVNADGASLSTYLWDVDDGTITVGTSASSAITATFPAGFRWVSLTVTDDNSKTHTTRVPVYARNPAADTTIDVFQITEHNIRPEGQRVALRILESIPESTYPDGTLAMIADGEPSSAADRSNLVFVGWHLTDPASIAAQRTGLLSDTSLVCVDVARKLDLLPALPVAVEHANTPDKWAQMETPNIDKFLHYILQWHSTALDVADFTNTGTGTDMKFFIKGTEGQSLFDTVDRLCRFITPDYHFTCNTLGQLQCVVDPLLQDSGDRTATIQATLTEDDWSDLRFEHIRYPRLNLLHAGAILARQTSINVVVCRAPGTARGQGENEMKHGEQLAADQDALNSVTGHRYARINAPESPFRITLAEGDDLDIEPADYTWVKLTMSSDTAAQRGLAFTEERGLPLELNVRYEHARTGLIRTVQMMWERETEGTPAVTEVPKSDPQKPDDDLGWDVPNYETPSSSDFYEPVGAYIIWDNDHIGRTWDMLASPPVWELVDTGISGTIIDCQYVTRPNGNETVGLWCLTSAGVFWCADIFAGTPSWSNTYSLATMQAAEVAPTTGSARFMSMFNHGARPGYLIVATEPDSGLTTNVNWPHAYFHFTDDYGATWTVQDSADELTRTTGGGTAGYMYGTKFAVNWFRDNPGRIYAIRTAPRYIANDEEILMYSDDDGATWALGYTFPQLLNSEDTGSVLNPFPNATDMLLVQYGDIGAYPSQDIWISYDNGDTFTEVAAYPTGTDGFILYRRPNSKHAADGSNTNHIIGWASQNASPYERQLWDSDDAGATWNLLWDTGGVTPQYETPNGWPPDPNVWFTVRYTDGGSSVIWMTNDYFVTTPPGTDKTGNLLDVGVFADWTNAEDGDSGIGGIAMPKIGANA